VRTQYPPASSSAGPQLIGVLRSMNRMSNPIRSYRARMPGSSTLSYSAGRGTPGPPGPPPVVSRTPCRNAGSVAGSRETAISMVRPCGRV
jgi:hypothetical protein